MSLTIGFVGLGLIGGSIAKGLKRKDPAYRIIAYNRNKDVLLAAKLDGVIDEMAEEIGEKFAACDIIFLCAPVQVNAKHMELLKPYLKENAILTDVGSTKTEIMEIAASLGLQKYFIGGHPMAGSERSGYAYSSDHLVENAYYIITPFPETHAKKQQRLVDLVYGLMGIPMVMDADEHDRIVATVSHVPHLIAFALVDQLKSDDDEDGTMKQIAAGGFKDITRIAASSPEMWEQICLSNRRAINEVLDEYIEKLEKFRGYINEGRGAALKKIIGEVGAFRDTMDSRPMGVIKRDYSLYVDIEDKPGAIAGVVNILAVHRINIKNLGVLYNREYEENVFKIDFYEASARDKALDVLQKNEFIVSKKS